MKKYFKILSVLLVLLSSCSKDEELILSSESKLISFSIKEIDASFEINKSLVETNLNDEIDLTQLTAVFRISNKAKAYIGKSLQTSGYAKKNYSEPVKFTIKAEDGSQTDYLVVINTKAKLKTFKIIELNNVSFVIDNFDITAQVPYGTHLKDLRASFTTTKGASLFLGDSPQISGETKNNFNQPVTYHLKTNGEIAEKYTVTVKESDNIAPIAKAGEDKIAILAGTSTTVKVNLDASESSDIEGEIAAYKWELNGSIIGDTKILETELPIGTHTVKLVVTDGSGEKATDTVVVDVRLQGVYAPIDLDATTATVNLFNNIAALANGSQFAFGQEFPMSFQLNSLRTSINDSDCKDVTGDHPAVYGIDPHYLMYKSAAQKKIHLDEAKFAYNQGSIVTFDFHQQSKSESKIYINNISSKTDKSLMYDIVNDLNGSRAWFYDELDQVLDIVNNDLGFPIVFRLYHEMDGDWFWWGSSATNASPELYIDLYRLAADYIKDRTNLVLFAWTPNKKINVSYYPGDSYVDVVGIDVYNPIKSILKADLIELSDFATAHNKVAILSEVGKTNYISSSPNFWTSNITAAIEEGGSDIRLAWVLAWFNAPWHSSQNDLYIPNKNSSDKIKKDFVTLYNNEKSLFQKEMNLLNIYD